MSQVRIAVDYENNAEEFWGHLNTYDVIHDAFISYDAKVAAAQLSGYGEHGDLDEVIVDKAIADELLTWFATLPGWDDGSESAPHPVMWDVAEDAEVTK